MPTDNRRPQIKPKFQFLSNESKTVFQMSHLNSTPNDRKSRFFVSSQVEYKPVRTLGLTAVDLYYNCSQHRSPVMEKKLQQYTAVVWNF